ncbi:MAG: hypothetical protein ACYC0D_08915 [Candidatus Humimicrobiaceae bacterium]
MERNNRNIEQAVAGNCQYIISDDKKHLRELKNYKDMGIVSIAEFLE